MRVVLYTNIVSPHQIPLSLEITKIVGPENFRYIYTEAFHAERSRMGWKSMEYPWCIGADSAETHEWLENADLLLSGNRAFDVFERRVARGLKTYYMSERWFKPPFGALRLLHPRYLRMAVRMVGLIKKSPTFLYLPIGVHAARDMARLYGLLNGDMRCIFRTPSVVFERRPMGEIANCPWMMMWGYFVAPSSQYGSPSTQHSTLNTHLRVLWVGRMLKLKRVDTIIRAVAEVAESGKSIVLTIVGDGPEKGRLQKLAKKFSTATPSIFNFLPSVSIDKVRFLMRNHDAYVFSSNGYEGWGAVVSEALEECMCVFGSYESGSSATMLPQSQLFHCSDWRALSRCLALKKINSNCIGAWTARNGACSFLEGGGR